MRLTIWQFVALVAALVGGYLVYSLWWGKLDTHKIIHDTNTTLVDGEPGKQLAPAQAPSVAPSADSKSTGDGSDTHKTW